MFSLSTGLQAAGNASANSAAPPAASITAPTDNGGATSPEATDAHAAAKHERHAMKQHPMHRRDTTMATAMSTGTGDPAYRAALKDCVAGPDGQRDSCIDDAIARFGQS